MFGADPNVDAKLDAAASSPGGAVQTSSGPLIPVRNPGKAYKPSGAGSVNALEHGLSNPAGRVMALTPDAASNAIFGWDLADQKAFAKKVWYLGGISSPEDIAGAWKVWQQAVQVAAGFSAAGNPMDPQDVVDLMLTGDAGAAKARAQHKLAGKTITTQKANPINLADPAEVRVFLDEAFRTKMGRAPTDAEVRTLTDSLHAAQKAHPGMSQVQTTYDANGNVASQQQLKATGGVNPDIFLNDQIANDPEAASYQAGTTYFNALMGALGPGA